VTEYTFVMNPAAAKGAAQRTLVEVERLLPGLGATYEVIRTQCTGHATQIARASESRNVVAVGGDGTVNEVANGIMGSRKTLGVIPTGSGNDFVKSVGIPRRLQSCIDILRALNVRRIDAGMVRVGNFDNGSTIYASQRYFVNGVGIGFDASVAQRVSEISYQRGTLLYLVAVLQILGKFKVPEFRISADGYSTTGKRLLIAAGNGKSAGGGFYLTPEATVDDGRLDVCMIQDVSVLTILGLIPKVLSGKRLEHKAVSYLRTASLQVESNDLFKVHADGEVVGRDVNGVQLGVEPGAILMIGPRGGPPNDK